MKHMMTKFVNTDGLSEKYGTITNEELLQVYRKEEEE